MSSPAPSSRHLFCSFAGSRADVVSVVSAVCTQQVQKELAPVKQELGNDLIKFAADESVPVAAEFPGLYTVVWQQDQLLHLNPSC